MERFAIQTLGLSKSYGDKPALRTLNLTIESGEIFGLLGHNGAGKTTAVNLLTTLLEPTSGSMTVAGVDGLTHPEELRHLIGYLPESVHFYDNLSTMENLRFFAKLSGLMKPDDRIREVLEYLNFSGHENERIETFSKGMRQRVGIAQAILHMPKVLFLDEPTSGLDPMGVRELRDVIVSLNRDFKMTIFMNTHLLSEVTKTCTSIGVLRQGELIYQNSLEATLLAFPSEESLEEIYLQMHTRSTP
jgi:ABC-2 type transport system ATP-binding protein